MDASDKLSVDDAGNRLAGDRPSMFDEDSFRVLHTLW